MDLGGVAHVWRMDLDGTHLKQLTSGSGEDNPECSPDGKWVVYRGFEPGKGTLFKVPLEGGAAVPLTDKPCSPAMISPDGKQIAFGYVDPQAGRIKLAVISAEGGPPLKLLDVPSTVDPMADFVRWTPDGSALVAVDDRSGTPNLWALPLAGGPARPLTRFTSEQDHIFNFAWSRDGKRLALARGPLSSDVILISDFR